MAQVKSYRDVSVYNISVDIANVAANSRNTEVVTITGDSDSIRPGDFVAVMPPSGLNAGLVVGGAFISAVNQVSFFVANVTAAAQNPGAQTYTFLVIRA
jgi:predicted transcriptional regulator